MRLATVTFHCAYNYGAVLQAYALIQALRSLGHDACVLDYWPVKRVKAAETIWSKIGGSKGLFVNGIIAIKYSAFMKKRENFNAFREEFLPKTSTRYHSIEDILESKEIYDGYVAGSDQVWNPASGIDPVYFLQFAKKLGSKSIAYAPSIGLPKIEDKFRDEMTALISEVDVLSSREHRGVEIIEELTGRSSEVVVDPVFLLSQNDWKKIVKPMNLPDKYILVYAVRRRAYMEKAINKLKKKLGLPVVLIVGENPGVRGFINADYVMWDVGPQEFITLFSRATYVCTNSFHGTAFSIIFEKPFLSFSHTKGDSRVSSILKRAGLEKSIVYEDDPFPFGFDLNVKNSQLLEEINLSLKYLENSLRLS